MPQTGGNRGSFHPTATVVRSTRPLDGPVMRSIPDRRESWQGQGKGSELSRQAVGMEFWTHERSWCTALTCESTNEDLTPASDAALPKIKGKTITTWCPPVRIQTLIGSAEPDPNQTESQMRYSAHCTGGCEVVSPSVDRGNGSHVTGRVGRIMPVVINWASV